MIPAAALVRTLAFATVKVSPADTVNVPVLVNEEMVGHKFGEFSPTRVLPISVSEFSAWNCRS